MDLERLKASDEDAFRALVREQWPPLVHYLTTLAARPEAAEDAAQEAFVRLWEHRERWQGATARGLLFHIGRNVVLDQRRRAGVRERLRAEVALRGPPASDPAGDAESAEVGARILAAVARLPLRRREVFELVRLHGLSYREAAQALDISG
jgi:RNA polymerase sigma-70 factor (ECF subfamily)